jgi:hypothetical protein
VKKRSQCAWPLQDVVDEGSTTTSATSKTKIAACRRAVGMGGGHAPTLWRERGLLRKEKARMTGWNQTPPPPTSKTDESASGKKLTPQNLFKLTYTTAQQLWHSYTAYIKNLLLRLLLALIKHTRNITLQPTCYHANVSAFCVFTLRQLQNQKGLKST